MIQPLRFYFSQPSFMMILLIGDSPLGGDDDWVWNSMWRTEMILRCFVICCFDGGRIVFVINCVMEANGIGNDILLPS